MTIEKKLLGTTPVSGEVLPEAVSFDGTNDYLKRTSDMTGNADGKTWTFSAWVYNTGVSQNIYSTYQSRFQVICQGNYFTISAKSTTEDAMFASYPNAPLNTWNHILISCNQASTSQRHIYINGVAHTTFNTYVNGNIDFTETQHYIGAANSNHIYKLKGRLAHVYLDKTYRDLSVTANRRLFIDADGKPADSDTLAALNPIMYMPLIDAATAGSNSGTGGDFTVNGVLATAERGPNQDNCSASTFDGSADYLRISGALTGATNNKLVTVSFSFNPSAGSGSKIVIGGGSPLRINIRGESDRWLFSLFNTSGSNIITWQDGTGVVPDRMNHVTLSCDLSDTSKRHVFVNGVATATTPSTYTNSTIDHSFSIWEIGRRPSLSSHYYAGTLGELYYDNTYTDLSADNPFWDSDTNRPNSVRKVIEDTGVTPLIALPLMGNDAGNNLGSGGDFTVNSGPFTGARGGSEFWARSAITGSDGASFSSTGTNLSLADTNTLTVAFALKTDDISSQIYTFNGGGPFFIEKSSSNVLSIAFTLKNSTRYTLTSSINLASSGWNIVLISIDTANDNYNIIVNGVASTNSTSIGNSQFDLAAIGSGPCNLKASGAANTNEPFAVGYLSASYYDFSQEVNRNKFVNQLGYINDLSEEGSPIIYMKFDPSSLGTNSGSGGNFTVNGTVTAGVDVTP